MANKLNDALPGLFITAIATYLAIRLVLRIVTAPLPTRFIFFTSLVVVGGVTYGTYKLYSGIKAHQDKKAWRKEMEASIKLNDLNRSLSSQIDNNPKNTEDLSNHKEKDISYDTKVQQSPSHDNDSPKPNL